MNFRLKDRFLYHTGFRKNLNESIYFSNTKQQKFKAETKAWVVPLRFKHTKTPCEITIHIFDTLRLTLILNVGQREKLFSVALVNSSTDVKWLLQAQCSPSSTGPRTCSSYYVRYHPPAYHRNLVLWQTVPNTQITTLTLDALLYCQSLEEPSLPMDIIQNCWASWQNRH